MANKVEEMKKDISELQSLEKVATRQKVKDIISIETRKLTSELIKLENQLREQVDTSSKNAAGPATKASYEVTLKNYAWDQTDKFVKFYVTLQNVQQIPAENVKCFFTAKTVELYVSDLGNKDYSLKIKNLLNEIDPQQSNWKIKTDMVIINVAKVKLISWSHVTELEKKAAESKTPKLDENADPSEGIMNLMKNMYEQGDDEMKRTIAKAWTESRNKGLDL